MLPGLLPVHTAPQDPALGLLNAEVGSTLPNTYQGQCVAIVYGPPPVSGSLQDLLNRARTAMIHSSRPIVGPNPATILKELTRWSTAYRLLDLHRLLDPPPNFHIRTVRDIEHDDSMYTLASGFNEQKKLGFIGALVGADQRLAHFRFTSDRVLIDSLTMFPGEDLWWTRQDVAGLRSPYFPFRKEVVNLVPKFTRLVDNYVVPSNLPPSYHTQKLMRGARGPSSEKH